MLAAHEFRFLNLTARHAPGMSWDDPARLRLWRYNLHYFDDLNATGAGSRADWHRALVRRWIGENPAPMGSGWEPYPTSLRIVNWIRWDIACRQRGDEGLDAPARDSLAVQVRWLRGRLEHHLLGNHLLTNAKALLFAGLYFDGAESDAWRATGLRLWSRELAEQVLADGGHFERSPMYHSIVLEDLLAVIAIATGAPGIVQESVVAGWRATSARMLDWLRVMTHPDGRIALFNDAAFGIAPELAELQAYAQRVGVSVSRRSFDAIEVLPDSGYVRLERPDAVLICDVGEVGPDYLPAHAHADTLSFELSLYGRRVFVNGGTSTYEPGSLRSAERATRAHNTVEVDGENSSEVWGAFRVARRARPLGVRWGTDAKTVWLEAAHDGYRRLRGRVLHRRRWALQSSSLRVEDSFEGQFAGAVSRLLLHPSLGDPVLSHDAHSSSVSLNATESSPFRVASITITPAELQLERSSWHPEFGVSQPINVLSAPCSETGLTTDVSW